MKKLHAKYFSFALLLAGLLLAPGLVQAQPTIQCPGDANGDAIIDNPAAYPTTKCISLGAGDGFNRMADGRVVYTFGFSNLTGVLERNIMNAGLVAAGLPAPTVSVTEGDDVYLNLTNVGMLIRPDLFDPHTVHWHGYPNASAVFDGVPDSSIAINMGATLTYYYKGPHPGTYMYHCHVEATEHMQMGMLGNLYVKPLQDGTPINFEGRTYTKFAYNDGDGSTGYDVDYPLQLTAVDSRFHDANETVQPLPFALMDDNYFLINGRGYPDTVGPPSLVPPVENGSKPSQNVSSLITASQGQRILLRISDLNISNFDTIATIGIPMQVVGKDARQLRGPTGQNLYYKTNSVTLGGGEAVDVILDTVGVTPGTYFLYTTNLNRLSNFEEDYGGMMTEIVVGPPAL